MTKTNCVNCNKKVNTKKDDYATGESLGEIWCLACTYQDAYEVTQERLDLVELAEAKARMETEASEEYLTALLKKRVLQVEALQAENERLRDALKFYADEENNRHTESFTLGQIGRMSEVAQDEGYLARKALAGDSNAI